MQPISFINILSILLLLVLAFSCSQSLAKLRNPSSLIFGLTHSKTIVPRKGSNAFERVKLQSGLGLSIMEKLREVRDGYLLSLALGTPPQVIQVYMDTGSDLTWVPCGNLTFDCLECDKYVRINKLMGGFSPTYSSSALRVLCSSPFCSQIHNSDNPYDPCVIAGCSLSTLLKGTCLRPCPSFAYTYGEGNVVVGTLTKDVLKVQTNINLNATSLDVQKFRFGCVGSTYKEPLGIAGFGRGPLSLPAQLGFLQTGFSYCFVSFKFVNNPNVSSLLIMGDIAITNTNNSSQFTPLLTNPKYPNYYYIALEGITIGNTTSMKQAPLTMKEFDAKGNGGMMIDSGTTYTHLPEPLYSELLSHLESLLTIQYPRATEEEARTGFDLCYKIPCPNNNVTNCLDYDELPSITFHFMNNVSLVLPRANHFYAVGPPTNSTVVKCLMYQAMDEDEDTEEGGPAAVFGSFQQQNVEVIYDLEKERIGFRQLDCAAAYSSYSSSQGLHNN